MGTRLYGTLKHSKLSINSNTRYNFTITTALTLQQTTIITANTMESLYNGTDTIGTSKLVLLMEMSFVEGSFKQNKLSKWDKKSVPCSEVSFTIHVHYYCNAIKILNVSKQECRHYCLLLVCILFVILTYPTKYSFIIAKCFCG